MTTINATNARKNFYKLIEEVNNESKEIIITNSKGKNVVMISEDDYNALQETIYLHSVTGLVESILEADEENPKEMEEYNPKEEW